jgi:farnesyl diphosphate synthase
MTQAQVASPRLADWLQLQQAATETALAQHLPADDGLRLHAAMRYAALDGGKRIRPLLAYAAGELFGANADCVSGVACAVEMMHAYSLVHDDMPCMDDDALRRGKPTVHVRYDQATALLAGDALQAQAFLVLAGLPLEPARCVMMLRLLAQASGAAGMCGGQAIDLASVGVKLSLSDLEHMHRLKTGALLRAAVLLGATCGKMLSVAETSALDDYANAIGLAFQVVDDVLDATADSTTLGKTAGKDAADNKPTYVSILGLDASRLLATKLCNDAHRALDPFGDKAQHLRDLADLIVQRKA